MTGIPAWLRSAVIPCALGVLAPNVNSADLQAARTGLAARGLALEVRYTGELAAHLSGRGHGHGHGEWDSLGILEAELALDGARLAGRRGMSALVHWIRPHGSDPSATAGDLQGISNIAAPGGGRILEAWVEQNLLQDRVSLLFGRYDLNTEFYVLRSAGLFLNSSFGIGPEFSQTGVGGPSIYPDTSNALRLEGRPLAGLTLRAAILEGAPARAPRRSGEGSLLVGEASFGAGWGTSQAGERELRSTRRRAGRAAQNARRGDKLAFGAWRYTAEFDQLSLTDAGGAPLRQSGSGGAYVIGESTLYRDPVRASRRLRAFAQLGFGDPDVARIGRYFGAGLTLTAPFSSRPDDEAGFAIARAANGDAYMESERLAGRAVSRAETVVELTYLMQVSRWLVFQPSLQYIDNPGTDPARPNAAALLLRVEASL